MNEHCASSWVCTSPLAVNTTVGVLDLLNVCPSLSELKSFLLSMCIDAPESITNSRSTGVFEVGAGVALASIGQLKHTFVLFFLSLKTHFAKSHATPRA